MRSHPRVGRVLRLTVDVPADTIVGATDAKWSRTEGGGATNAGELTLRNWRRAWTCRESPPTTTSGDPAPLESNGSMVVMRIPSPS